MRGAQSTLLTLGALIASLGLGWMSAYHTLLIAVFGALVLSVLVISKVQDLWLIFFTVGVHFDDQFVNLGFSKAGYGDFALMVLIAYWALSHYRPSRSLQLPPKWPLLVLYVVGVGLSWLQGPTPQVVTGLYIRNTLYVLGYLALVDLIKAPKQLKLFLTVTTIVTMIHVIFALFFMEKTTRLEGLSGQPNIFGGLIGPGALIAILLSSSPLINKTWRLALALVGLFITAGLILTVSRGSQIAFFTALLWTFRRRWRGILIAGGLIALIIQLIYILEPDRLDYFYTRWEFEDRSISGRRDILFNAINIIFEKPIFGVGFAQFIQLETVMNIDSGHGRASHNHYLGEFATIGIPTALTLFYFIIHQGHSLWRLRDLKDPNSRLYLTIFQALFVFQSVALIFRGGRRMIEWTFLAVYTAAAIIYYQQTQTVTRRPH